MLNGKTSFHLYEAGSRSATRSALSGDIKADICIVGAGFTGLWAAWWLRQALPDRSIVIVEAQRVGYGASGRNLGWLSGKPVGDRRQLSDGPDGPDGPIVLRRACIDAITEIPALMRENGIDIEARQVGYLQVARNPAEMARVHAYLAERDSWHMTETDLRFLTAQEIRDRVRIDGAVGGLFSPHCVRIQPAKLVLGLARVVEARGVTIYENTRATEIAPQCVRTDKGTVRAPVVLSAMEAYGTTTRGYKRTILPMRSNVIATEPLSPQEWDAIGWKGGEGIFGSQHWPYFLTQTADGRILIAGRGFPYRFDSREDEDGLLGAGPIRQLQQGLKTLFPAIRPTVAHAWCGLFGIPRDWAPSVSFDPATGLGTAGGYGGQGVGSSYVAGRTLADLVAGRQTQWTRLPWTNRRSPDWEVEPLRWLGARASYHLFRMADTVEERSNSSDMSGFARLARRISGRA